MLVQIQKAKELKLKKLELEEATQLFPEPEGPEDASNLEYLGVTYEIYAKFSARIEAEYRQTIKADHTAANELLALKVADLSSEEKAALMDYHKTRFTGIKNPLDWAQSWLN